MMVTIDNTEGGVSHCGDGVYAMRVQSKKLCETATIH